MNDNYLANNIECFHCGICLVACPIGAITLNIKDDIGLYVPSTDYNKCIKCGNCQSVCMGKSKKIIFNNIDEYIDHIENIYIGYTNNEVNLINTSSGGLVTELLLYLINEKIVDKVLVTKYNKNNPLIAESTICSDAIEILESANSKYCPVYYPESIINYINAGCGSIAVVGLPCHISAIKKLIENGIIKKNKILFIGLMCNHTPSFFATQFILDYIGINNNDVVSINYRANSSNLGMEIITHTHKYFIPHTSKLYWGGIFDKFFYPLRCTYCDDKLARDADVVFGDAWLPNIEAVGNRSIFITRNTTIEDIILDMEEKGLINMDITGIDSILISQGIDATLNKLNSRLGIVNMIQKNIVYCHKSKKIIDVLYAIIFYLTNYIMNKKITRIIIMKLMKIKYNNLYYEIK